jgi:hypothetical protein
MRWREVIPSGRLGYDTPWGRNGIESAVNPHPFSPGGELRLMRRYRFAIELPANCNPRALRPERYAGTLGPCVVLIS